MSALTFFKRMHANGDRIDSWIVMALHWPWSLTWRWIISWSAPQPIVVSGHRYPRAYFLRTHRGCGINFIAGLRIPLLGHFAIHTQPNMRRAQGDDHAG